MQKGMQFLDKRAGLMFYQMSHRSQIDCVSKLQRQVPMLICHSKFTNILNQMFAKQLLRPQESEIKKYLHDNAVGENTAVRTLMDLLNIDKLKAQQIVKSSLVFENISRQNLIDNHGLLLSLGYDTKSILKHVRILAQSRQGLSEKIEYLKNATDIRRENMELNFFRYCMISLKKFIKVYQSMNKKSSINDAIEDFAKKFEVLLSKLKMKLYILDIDFQILFEQVDTNSMFKLIAVYLHRMTSKPEDTMSKLKILMGKYKIAKNHPLIHKIELRFQKRLAMSNIYLFSKKYFCNTKIFKHLSNIFSRFNLSYRYKLHFNY